MSFIEINDVIKIYNPYSENSVSALRGVNLKINHSELVSLIGPSGCGKTTLIKLIGLYIKPTAGKIAIEEISDIFKLKEHERIKYHQETLGYVSQFSSINLIKSWSVEDNIKIPMKLANRLSREEMKKRIIEILEKVDLSSQQKRKVYQLSGGEAQRVSFGVAMANNPKLILADEPTGELDTENTYRIVEIMKDIVSSYNTTVLVVTHNKIIAENSKHSWKMEDGRISGLYKASSNEEKKESKRTFFVSIDSQGHLRIPKDVLEKSKLNDTATIEYNEATGKIEITPEKK